MFDAKTAVASFIDSFKNTFAVSVTLSAISNEDADSRMTSGRTPLTTQAVFVLGDMKETRSKFSRGFNRVEIELHANYYWRTPPASSVLGETVSDYFQTKLTNDELGQSYAMVINVDAEPAIQLVENIWRKRYIIKIITYETTTA